KTNPDLLKSSRESHAAHWVAQRCGNYQDPASVVSHPVGRWSAFEGSLNCVCNHGNVAGAPACRKQGAKHKKLRTDVAQELRFFLNWTASKVSGACGTEPAAVGWAAGLPARFHFTATISGVKSFE